MGHLALLLPNGNVDAGQVLALLTDYGVYGDGRLASGAVADDQLPLASADGYHCVDGLDASLYRGVHRLAGHHVGRYVFHRAGCGGADEAFTIDGPSQGVHHPSDEAFSHGDLDDASRGAYRVPFLDGVGVAHDGCPHRVLLQVQGQSHDVIGKLQDLAVFGTLKPLDTGDAIAHLDHSADVHQTQLGAELLYLSLQYRNYVLAMGSHDRLPPTVCWRQTTT